MIIRGSISVKMCESILMTLEGVGGLSSGSVGSLFPEISENFVVWGFANVIIKEKKMTRDDAKDFVEN